LFNIELLETINHFLLVANEEEAEDFKGKEIMRESLVVFEFTRLRSFLAGLISTIILLITFFVYVLIVFLIQPKNNLLIGVTFFGIMIGVSQILVLMFSGFAYRNISQICYDNDQLVNKRKDNTVERFANIDIESLVFYYQGDIQWRATNPKFQKYKSWCRYKIKRSFYRTELQSFDKIIINSRIFLVKINDFADKDYFYKIVEWANQNNLKYELNETKYYSNSPSFPNEEVVSKRL